MDNTRRRADASKTYFVFGSGLMAVPYERLNEIPRLKKELHDNEVNWGFAAVWARKLA